MGRSTAGLQCFQKLSPTYSPNSWGAIQCEVTRKRAVSEDRQWNHRPRVTPVVATPLASLRGLMLQYARKLRA